MVFLVFAASMMLFYQANVREVHRSWPRLAAYGVSVGGVAGYLGGLLGVGGGNFIVPVLVWLGFDPKRASATTAFIVIFSSLSGFLGKASMGAMDGALVLWTAGGSVAGALLGSWLMQRKLQSAQVKNLIGVILAMMLRVLKQARRANRERITHDIQKDSQIVVNFRGQFCREIKRRTR